MDLSFASAVLREAARKEKKAVAMVGVQLAPPLLSRIADLRAAPSAADLPPLLFELCDPVDGPPVVRARLLGSISLISVLIPRSYSTSDTGMVDWNSVDRIKLTEIQGLEQ